MQPALGFSPSLYIHHLFFGMCFVCHCPYFSFLLHKLTILWIHRSFRGFVRPNTLTYPICWVRTSSTLCSPSMSLNPKQYIYKKVISRSASWVSEIIHDCLLFQCKTLKTSDNIAQLNLTILSSYESRKKQLPICVN